MIKESCTTCKFYQSSADSGGPPVCRRFPPVQVLNETIRHPDGSTGAWMTQFTILANPDILWCGEHQKKLILSS